MVAEYAEPASRGCNHRASPAVFRRNFGIWLWLDYILSAVHVHRKPAQGHSTKRGGLHLDCLSADPERQEEAEKAVGKEEFEGSDLAPCPLNHSAQFD